MVTVEFRLLGDLDVRINGQALQLGPARWRCVLVSLLVDVNRCVSIDQLVDRVWADHSPRCAREVLYSYLSRLRQALAPARDVRIDRQSGGYVLRADPMMVDLHHFHRLLQQARAINDDESAVMLFDQALGLWRGPAFAVLDTPWLNSVRDDLDRQRRAAELDRNDIALRCGRHTVLLPELISGADAHPLDERLAGQLMLALYRSSRQADALEHYQRLRLRLVDELGVDPSPLLQQLYQRILTADSTLVATAQMGRPANEDLRTPVPRQLPISIWSFTCREPELAQLDAILNAEGMQTSTVIISTVSGTAGIGKTALAVHWAHRVAGRFPDGQLFVNLRGFDPCDSVMEPAEAIRLFLDALGVTPQRMPRDLDAQAALYRSLLASRRMLIVLDNGSGPPVAAGLTGMSGAGDQSQPVVQADCRSWSLPAAPRFAHRR